MNRNAFTPIVVVSNTGPLLSAFQCNRTDLLARYFARIHIPASEMEEFERHDAGDQLRELIKDGLVVVEHLSSAEAASAKDIARRIAVCSVSKTYDHHHHLPEAEAIVLAQREELEVSRVLLEENAARQIAQQLGLLLTGFIGVLLLACDEQLLTPGEMRILLETCRQCGTHYSDKLIDQVCQQCEELVK
jgi:predicted nucleic acid-binding protein